MNTLANNQGSRLCTLTVTADSAGTDIIGASYLLYHTHHYLSTEDKLYQLRKIKESIVRLRATMSIVDDLMDEWEGRKPPVKVDEQVAA